MNVAENLLELADVIEIGAKKHEEAVVVLFVRNIQGEVISTCALGAAHVGKCGVPGDEEERFVAEERLDFFFPCLNYSLDTFGRISIRDWIVQMNDGELLSRQEIAGKLREKAIELADFWDVSLSYGQNEHLTRRE